MAHEIYNNQFAHVGQKAWHGLGTQLQDGATAQDFLKAANLDWEVISCQMKAEFEGELIDVPSKRAFIRSTDRKLMTVAGPEWTPFQNKDALEFMQKYADAGKATLDTAGALRDGQIVWGLAKLNHSFETRPGDRTEGYILITSPHQVGRAITVATTTIRVVCANTMALADREGKVNYRQNHLSEFNVAAARASIEAAHEQLSEAERRCKALDQLKISIEDAALKIVAPVFIPEMLDLEYEDQMEMLTNSDKMPKKMAEIIDSIYNAPGAVPETAYGILQGITHWADHVAGSTQEIRMTKSFAGDYKDKKIFAEKLLLELADYNYDPRQMMAMV